MKSIFLLSCIVILAVHAAEIPEEEDVLVLSKDNFDQAVKENEYILIEFYAPWCGHCKSLAPEYAKAAKLLKDQGSPIRLAKVDATVETSLGDQFQIRGYPTLKWFKNGTNAKEYSGGRKAPDIVSWVQRNVGPAVTSLDTVDDAKAFSEKDDVVIIGYFSGNDTVEALAYIAAADGLDTVNFGIVTCSEVTSGMGADENSVVLYKKFDDGKVVFPATNWTAESILEFIAAERIPLVSTFSDETAPVIFGGNVKSHLLVFFDGKDAKYDEYMNNLKPVAKTFKGKLLVVHIRSNDEDAERIMEFFNIEKSNLPAIRLIHLSEDMKRYVPESQEINAEKLTSFVQDYFDGNLSPHLNTEEIPEDWDANPVKVLVGKNFKEVALDNTKHVFVEFYAPWCGHCKQLAPIWDKLGEHFKDDKEVVIAKMDSTKNEVEAVQIQGFPTLYFFPKDSTEPLAYEGGRTLDELIKYVEDRIAGKPIEESKPADDDEPVDEDEGYEPLDDEEPAKDEL